MAGLFAVGFYMTRLKSNNYAPYILAETKEKSKANEWLLYMARKFELDTKLL